LVEHTTENRGVVGSIPTLATDPRYRRRRLWTAFALLALLFLASAAIVRAETKATPGVVLHRTVPALLRLPGRPFHPAWPREGQAAVGIEGLGGFGVRGRQVPVPIASVAKMMTAYLTLREHPLAPGREGFRIRITQADVEDLRERIALDESVVEVRAGESLSERQALEALMLPSANNVAALLAVRDAGSIGAFVARMNRSAARLGMRRTHYTDPSGFEPTTVSTSRDQIKLARAAMEDPAFARIVAMRSARLPVAGRVVNYNTLVGHDGYVGIKTGSDEAAGGCLVFARRVEAGGRTLEILGDVFGQRDGELLDAARSAADRLASSVAVATRVETAIPAGTKVLVARSPDGHRVAGVTAQPVRQLGWPGMRVRVKVRLARPGDSLADHQRLGTLTVHGSSVRRVPIVAQSALSAPSLGWRLMHLP
jgi:serine-type D-Ala-D-Ala carboxypeptidase (penicillin-binding protein 5/6)